MAASLTAALIHQRFRPLSRLEQGWCTYQFSWFLLSLFLSLYSWSCPCFSVIFSWLLLMKMRNIALVWSSSCYLPDSSPPLAIFTLTKGIESPVSFSLSLCLFLLIVGRISISSWKVWWKCSKLLFVDSALHGFPTLASELKSDVSFFPARSLAASLPFPRGQLSHSGAYTTCFLLSRAFSDCCLCFLYLLHSNNCCFFVC